MSFLLDAICVIILAAAVRRGWRRGILSVLVKLLGWIAAAVVIGNMYDKWEGTAVRILIAVVVLSLCLGAARLLSGLVRKRGPAGGILDKTGRFLGAAVGAVLGAAAVYIYAVLLTMLAGVVSADWLTPSIVEGTFIISRII